MISFKSVGKTTEEKNAESLSVTPPPIGIKTPMREGNGSDGIFAMHKDIGDVIADNLRNLVLTNWGERLVHYRYGANLMELTTEIVNKDDFELEAAKRISTAVGTWMSYVNLIDLNSDVDYTKKPSEAIALIRIYLTYDVPSLSITQRTIEIVLNAI